MDRKRPSSSNEQRQGAATSPPAKRARAPQPQWLLPGEARLPRGAVVGRTPYRTARAHRGGAFAARFSPCGRMVATAAGDTRVRVWDASPPPRGGRPGDESPSLACTVGAHGEAVFDAQWARGGDLLVSAGGDCCARVWKRGGGASWAAARVLGGHSDAVNTVSVREDGDTTTVATGSMDQTARVVSLRPDELDAPPQPEAADPSAACVLQGHSGWLTAVAFSPCGARVVTASDDSTVRVYLRGEGGGAPVLEAVLSSHTDTVRDAAWSPDGRFLVTASHDKTACVWDSRAWAAEVRRAPHQSSVYAVTVSHDGRWLATGCYDRTARVWDAGGRGEMGVMRGHTGYVPSVDASPCGRYLATASFDSSVRLWDVWRDGGAAAAVLEHAPVLPDLAALCADYC